MAHDGDSKICRITHIISIRKKRKYYVSASKKTALAISARTKKPKKNFMPQYISIKGLFSSKKNDLTLH